VFRGRLIKAIPPSNTCGKVQQKALSFNEAR
jgi:hypothetical protein